MTLMDKITGLLRPDERAESAEGPASTPEIVSGDEAALNHLQDDLALGGPREVLDESGPVL